MGQGALGAALLHRLESLPLYGLDLPTLLSDPSAPSPEHALVAKTRYLPPPPSLSSKVW